MTPQNQNLTIVISATTQREMLEQLFDIHNLLNSAQSSRKLSSNSAEHTWTANLHLESVLT